MKISEISSLLKSLKKTIGDEDRASGSEDDSIPSMDVTIATTDGKDWNYQTGDNSFTGGAYGFQHWHTLFLTRRSNCEELAREAVSALKSIVGEAR